MNKFALGKISIWRFRCQPPFEGAAALCVHWTFGRVILFQCSLEHLSTNWLSKLETCLKSEQPSESIPQMACHCCIFCGNGGQHQIQSQNQWCLMAKRHRTRRHLILATCKLIMCRPQPLTVIEVVWCKSGILCVVLSSVWSS